MISKNSPILTIVIPTKDRPNYIIHTIEALLNINAENFQIVVQDNSKGNSTKQIIGKYLNDKRLKYNHLDQKIDFCENFNIGAKIASGEYVTFIGDDDGVNPEIIKATEWAYKNDIDCLTDSRPSHYYWSDYIHHIYKDLFSCSLVIKKFKNRVYNIDVDHELSKCIKTVGRDFLSSRMPKLYYGIVKNKVLKEMRRDIGNCFPGPVPDLAGAVALTNYIKKAKYVDYPLFLPGNGGNSGAGLGAKKKHIGDLKNFPHIPFSSIKNWSKYVPALFSAECVWGEDIIQALKATNREDLLVDFNIPLLHAMCLVFDFDYRHLIMENFSSAVKSKKESLLKSYFMLLVYIIYTVLIRAKSLLKNLIYNSVFNRDTIIKPIENIGKAMEKLKIYLTENNHSFTPKDY